jgi:hypothetical protein
MLVTQNGMSDDDRQRIIVQQERDAAHEAGLRDYQVRLEKGSMVHQPSMVRHALVAHSEDVVILEVVTPGEFKARVVGAPAKNVAMAK